MTERNQLTPKLIWIVVALIFLRLFCSLFFGNRWALFSQPEAADRLLKQKAPAVTEPEVPVALIKPDTAPVALPESAYSFDPTDVSFIELEDQAKREPDIEMLLTRPLAWDLTTKEPSVLIFHTHGTEAFAPTEGYTYEEHGGSFRTTDEACNMLAVGQELARLLKEAGIHAVHDRTLYDYPDYTASYDTARTGLQQQLQKYPTVKLVIDLHRDSAQQEDGSQWATKATVNGAASAQVMLVMGADNYYEHPNWEKNLSTALKLQAIMEKNHEGVTRPLDLRKQRFNQDLSTGAIIAEIGAVGNTQQEAMNGVSALAEAIILLARGAN
jgi:stage II sporulation protein P